MESWQPDRAHMAAALALARRGLGRVAPNPSVGCVIVKDGRVVARGWTQPGGRPHAETEALSRAGSAAEGADCYVSLEPCSHHGKTAPCVDALIAAGITRCAVACEDPDERVAGSGIEKLRAAGIAVETGICEIESEALNAGYLQHRLQGRPTVTLKLASTLDGRIATAAGESRWITGDEARNYVQHLRLTHDAVLVGSGTAVADNPRLDVRWPGCEAFSPLRVVVDGRLRLPLTHDLVGRAGTLPTVLVTRSDADPARRAAFEAAGVSVVSLTATAGVPLPLDDVLKTLAERGVTRLLVEGGGHVAAGLLREGLVDRLVWFHAPKVIGGDGVDAVASFGLRDLAAAPCFVLTQARRLGEDLVETYETRA